MTEKGNKFIISGDNVTFTTTGEGIEYWQYQYDLRNRLMKVAKNGTIISQYVYDPDGLRVVKLEKGETTHYVFEGTEPIFEKKISNGEIKSYIHALGKHLARVDGRIGETGAKVYYYHTDHLGSVKAVTDQSGKVVYNADYMPFGSKFAKDGEFDELHGFTGKGFDPDTELYYFNARWYDAELGRFISEDSARDGNNWYVYGVNNPLINTDPTGRMHQNEDDEWEYDDWDWEWDDEFDCYKFWLYNDDFFAYEVGYWWDDFEKLKLAWDFLGNRDFGWREN